MRNGLIQAYPSLDENLKVDVAIIGAGVTGALVGYHLMQAGQSVALLERRHAGMGSTSSSTALLQYEIDTPLTKLAELVGEESAARSYQLCLEAIHELHDLSRTLKTDVGFELKKSLYYATYQKDVPDLRREYAIRKKHGFDLDFLEAGDVEKLMPFAAPAALLSPVSAQVDAYRLAHALLAKITQDGGRIFNQTEVKTIHHHARGVELVTQHDCRVQARRLVIAAGYESQGYLSQRVERLHSSYAIISEPLGTEREFWAGNCLIWETARPYLYLRTTPGGRILVGGKDEPFYSPGKRDALLNRKSRELAEAFQRLFPDIPFRTDFKWTGTFAETEDGLPYIGMHPAHPHTYFALGYGGNGITFSLIAAKFIRDHLTGRKNPDADLFAFDRTIRKPA